MLPRRVPWQSFSEFEQVFAWLFASEGDVDLQHKALARITTWIARGNCPQAVESTADLLDATLQAAAGTSSSHTLRLMYSMALIRFVNGLVDPVQQGYYARSIGSIAAQIGLPLHFVELRHAATHENLPSLPVLRDAVRRALDWLYQQFWLPHIQSVGASAQVSEALKEDLAKLVRSYRHMQQQGLKDATRADKMDLQQTVTAIEKLLAGISAQHGAEEGLGVLVDQLVSKNGLLSRHDREAIVSRSLALSPKSLAVWSPLLTRVVQAIDGLEQALLLRLLDLLCAAEPEDAELTSLSDASTNAPALLGAWTLHFVSSPTAPAAFVEIAVRLCLLHPNAGTLSLLQSLTEKASGLEGLLPIAQSQASRAGAPPVPEDVEARLKEMDARLAHLSRSLAEQDEAQTKPASEAMQVDEQQSWQLYNEATWRPCPIGRLPGGAADLTWPRAGT